MNVILIIAIVILLIVLVLGFLIIRSFKNPSQKHEKTPADEGIEYEVIKIPTKNKKNLYGWWISGEQGSPTIILMHGWGRNVGRLLPYIKKLKPKGFNLLAFDSRGHGSSDTDDFSSMVKFAEDISASIDYTEKIPDVVKDSAILIGLSIGGTASIYAAASDSRIKKIVTIGSPANAADAMAQFIRQKHIPYPIMWLAFEFMQFRIGKRFAEISAENNISKTKAKVLLIHGTHDKVVPFSQVEKIYKNAAPGQAEIWKIEGKGHSNCHYELGFWDKIFSFIG